MNLPRFPFFWRPSLTFTGKSIMSIGPATGQVSKHFDTWDSIEKQGYLNGPEGVAEVVKQVRPAPLLCSDCLLTACSLPGVNSCS